MKLARKIILTLILLMGEGQNTPAHFRHQNSGTAKDQEILAVMQIDIR